MAKTRGAKSSSPSSRLRVSRETPVQGAIPEPPRPLVVPPLMRTHLLSPPSRHYETRRPPTTPGQVLPELKKPQPSQPPAIESQIPSSMTPEVVIRRPMVTQPPIESNLDCKARGTIWSTDDSQGVFLSPCRIGLLSVHDHTPGSRSYCHPLYHRRTPWYSGSQTHSRALHIPYEPTRPEDYRVWTHPSQSDIVHILSRGASSRQYMLRKELPPSMFFIDALLHHNIFPLQHWMQRRGVLLEALFRISGDSFFGPHHLIMATILYFEEKVHRRSCSERMLFHFSSPDCYARFWTTWIPKRASA
ncbi:hypothetical protein CK203_113151 [Vitis vinifera]|uniref:Uncharacterized protein n=1 Tax=Vitis vinifera TaxID=29760 RepID=A0A438FE13_VITVI|nr:hypothetical protein CK203_113151 [Vitis vinifera]